jgi:hypothetical protein
LQLLRHCAIIAIYWFVIVDVTRWRDESGVERIPFVDLIRYYIDIAFKVVLELVEQSFYSSNNVSLKTFDK